MSTKEWYKPTSENISPFDRIYLEECRLPKERTSQEASSLGAIISAMQIKPRVLDIAGGFGRIGSELISQNLAYSLVNLDLNREFLDLARKNGVSEVVQADMRDLAFKKGSFDLALIMFTAFGYFNDEDNFRVLQEVYRVLDDDGVLVLDLPNYNRICNNFSTHREMLLGNGDIIRYEKKIEGNYLIEQRFRVVQNQSQKKLLPIKLRIYSVSEIVLLCQAAGFNELLVVDQELRGFSLTTSKRLWIIGTK
ncbi:MAG: class I SAM-dependent methyltransferase [Pseudomonadales bacterium]|nr:class I SAM-dependent methyltransferase [Pseudomonadales bacterium]